MAAPTLYAAFGHHKCATMWIHSIYMRAALDLGLSVAEVFLPPDFDNDLGGYVRKNNPDILLLGNAHWRDVATLDVDDVKGFHYVRDPRDIVVSAYFSHRNSHATDAWPELIPYREKLRRVSKEEGLFMELEFRAEQFEEMRSWRQAPEAARILELRMEDLTADPFRKLSDVFEYLGLLDTEYYTPRKRVAFVISKLLRRLEHALGVPLPLKFRELPAERLLGIVWEHEFKRVSGGRKRGEEDAGSHWRKGVHGDWVNHLTEEHVRVFKQRYNDLLLQYGYETEADWESAYLDRIRSAATVAE